MHALQSLYRCLTARCPKIHKKRVIGLCATAMAAVSGSVLSVSDLGRGIMGRVSAKHNIKRVDRLLSNQALHAEIPTIYKALTLTALDEMKRPLIIVDWSDLTPDRAWQLLRASVALEGRSITLYEQVHPIAQSASPEVHTDFLAKLATMLPPDCCPVIVTDAGFRSPWFESVSRMGWTWIGRIRHNDMVKSIDEESWEGCKTLYKIASSSAQSLGLYDYVRSHPIRCRLVLIKRISKGRHQRRLDGQPATSNQSRQHSRAQTEPWLLVVSPELGDLCADTIVGIYAKRMQIEEAFRDIKSERFGLGFSASRSKKPERIRVLLLIGALAMFILRLVGEEARAQKLDRQFQSNTRKSPHVLSNMTLARQFIHKIFQSWAEKEFNVVFADLQNGALKII
jgi:hypothetical protein